MKHKKQNWIWLVATAGVLLALYQQLNDSQKRFLQELGKQLPYLIPRYFA